MNFEQLYAPSLKELFVQKLQGMILSGELPMGEKLPSERELCQQMGVSRAVVNGGITELARQGFLEVRPRQGAYVADYRRDGNMETLAKLQLAGIDISVPALSLLEGQKRPVSDIELNALADILNVSVDWLLGRE